MRSMTLGVGYGESWRTTTRAEEVHDAVMRDSDGEGRSSTPNVDMPRRRSTSGAVEHVLDSMPMPEARNVCKAYGFEAKAAL